MNTLIIAEAGVNHNGDLGKAFDLVEMAAYAGADIVKFQTFKAETLCIKSATKAEYQSTNTGNSENQYEMLKKLELSEEDHYKIQEHCKKYNIAFLSSAFDMKSLNFLSTLDLPIYKVPSGEITNLPYLRLMGSFQKKIILSTGMSDMKEILDAIKILENAGTSRDKITVLHCSTEYPAPLDEVNLKAMLTIKEEFDVDIGYSDHTKGLEASLAAVSLGARVIEKNFTLDRNLPGPDHIASLEPEELKSMIDSIRIIERLLGSDKKIVTNAEKKNINIARKSIVANASILKGDIFSEKNITTKRPNYGISAMKWDDIINKTAMKDFDEDDFIEI